jgi:hypothetical protein
MKLLEGSILAVMLIFAFALSAMAATTHASPPGANQDRAAVSCAQDGISGTVKSTAKENNILSLFALKDVRLQKEAQASSNAQTEVASELAPACRDVKPQNRLNRLLRLKRGDMPGTNISPPFGLRTADPPRLE